MGFLAAIPIGASQFEVARRSLNGFLATAIIVVAGSVSSDFVYGAIALYGLAPFLQKPEVEAIFWLVNAALILVFAIGTLRESTHTGKLTVKKNLQPAEGSLEPSSLSEQESALGRKLSNRRLAYITGFSLAFTNPMMIAWWLLAARFLRDLGVINTLSNATRVVFLIAGCLGIGSYLTLFAVVIYRRHKSFSQKNASRVTRGFGIAMIFFAIYFVIRSIIMLKSPNSSTMPIGTIFLHYAPMCLH